MEILLKFHKSVRDNYIRTTTICLSLAYFLTLVPVILLFICKHENCNNFQIDFPGFTSLISDKNGLRVL